MEHFNFTSLVKLLSQEKALIIKWLQERGLILSSLACAVCSNAATLTQLGEDVKQRNAYFRCQRRTSGSERHFFKRSLFSHSWFANHKLGIDKTLIISYMFANGRTKYEELILETSDENTGTSTETISDWLSYCRETCLTWLLDHFEQRGPIGGPGKIVEIDETKLGKTKYHRGRKVEGHWILGLIERNDPEAGKGQLRLEILPDNKRDALTLTGLIERHVRKGTTIITDLWKGYLGLSSLGYTHLTVNHSVNFVDPVTEANTQTIESNWRALKRELNRGGIPEKNLGFHLAEYLWRRETRRRDKNLFLGFVETIVLVYNPNSTEETAVFDNNNYNIFDDGDVGGGSSGGRRDGRRDDRIDENDGVGDNDGDGDYGGDRDGGHDGKDNEDELENDTLKASLRNYSKKRKCV